MASATPVYTYTGQTELSREGRQYRWSGYVTVTGTYDSAAIPLTAADVALTTIEEVRLQTAQSGTTTGAFVPGYDDTNSVIRLWTGTNTSGLIEVADGVDVGTYVAYLDVRGR